MYNLNDTIVAVSSPAGGARSIVRITGPATVEICEKTFEPDVSSPVCRPSSLASRLIAGFVSIDNELKMDAMLYLFFAPHSYTGDDVAEIHLYAGSAVIEILVDKILKICRRGFSPLSEKSVGQAPPYYNHNSNYQLPITNHQIRMAGPGEFTARAYLNSKIDLAQAEAVNEIIVSSNAVQLTAAQKLLEGRLGLTTETLRSAILDCLSLLEAGLDFSDQKIEFASVEAAIERLIDIKANLSRLLSESGRLASVIDLPAVGITGIPNAGKSSLLNKLLGTERSIVSHERKTTRDVLAGELSLRHCRCVLFDCAGLLTQPEGILDRLAQQAAFEALRNSTLVIFCVDISKEDWTEDITVRGLIETKSMVPIATKCDLVSKDSMACKLNKLNEFFGAKLLPTSAKTGAGLENLRDTIDKKLIENYEFSQVSGVALTARHRQAVTEAIDNIDSAEKELKAGNDEIAAMMLRAAFQCISDIESGVDEQILQNIFSRFCIGK